MSKPARAGPFTIKAALLEAFATSDRINRFLIENLSDAAWRAEPPGGKGRTIAAIVSHMHNDRVMWLKMTGHRSGLPAHLRRQTVTRAQALKAFPKSRDAILKVLNEALEGDGRLKNFPPDAVTFFTAMVAHDAHHRGQIVMLARLAGHPIPDAARWGIWHWSKRWREAVEG